MTSTDIRILQDQSLYIRKFWLDLVDKRYRLSSVRIAGEHYTICQEFPQSSQPRGHSGRKFTIQFNDGRQVETTNLWSQGTIPPEFKDDLPDNARFV